MAEAQRHESNANDNCLILNSDKYAHIAHSKRHQCGHVLTIQLSLTKGSTPSPDVHSGQELEHWLLAGH